MAFEIVDDGKGLEGKGYGGPGGAGRAVDVEATDEEPEVEEEAEDEPEDTSALNRRWPDRCLASTACGLPTSGGTGSLAESDIVETVEAVLLEARRTVEIGSRVAFEERARLRSSMILASSG
jgi:hypothetical protein